jgi:uroporphyrinogen-III synthase
MHILVTRPEPGASELRHRLEAAGHRVTLAPMLTIETDPAALQSLDGIAALIATSRNGLRALIEGPHLAAALALPLFVVGPGTAKLAREMGFRDIVEGTGTAAGLQPVIAGRLNPAAGALLHLAGEEVAFNLKGVLEASGYAVRQPQLYRAVPATRIEPEAAQQIAEGGIDAVIVMSPRTADVLAHCLSAEGLRDAARGLTYVCLSETVARHLAPLGPLRMEVAHLPNLDALLGLLDRLSAATG